MNKDYIVTKSNSLICANYNLTLQEQRIILTLASKVQPSDKEFKEYQFSIKDFVNLLDLKSKNLYQQLKKITKELMKKVFEIKINENIDKQLAWLCSATYLKREGIIILKFAPDLKPFLLELKTFFTEYKLENILRLKSKYSIRVYEILKSHAYKKQVTIELSDFKKMIGATAEYFKIYADFKRNVLQVTQSEIKVYTDIYFEFEEVREGRRIVALKFDIYNQNSQNVNQMIKEDTPAEVDINEDDYDDIIIKIRARIQTLTKSKITYDKTKELLELKGSDKINLYLDNYHKFKINKHNPTGFIIKAIMDEYPIPVEEININQASKPIQSTNFDQRVYDDDFFDSLYDNFREQDDKNDDK